MDLAYTGGFLIACLHTLLKGKRMHGSRKLCQWGYSFLVDEGRVDPNTTETGHHWSASETPFKSGGGGGGGKGEGVICI